MMNLGMFGSLVKGSNLRLLMVEGLKNLIQVRSVPESIQMIDYRIVQCHLDPFFFGNYPVDCMI